MLLLELAAEGGNKYNYNVAQIEVTNLASNGGVDHQQILN